MTTHRNISPYAFFERLAAEHEPAHAFTATSKRQFESWQKALLPKVLATLGELPKKVKPNAELLAEWQEDGLVKQRWVIDTQPGLSAILLLFRPAELTKAERRPAIHCAHGHGAFGKDSVMGVAPSPERRQQVQQLHYDYGLEMARAGFVTYAIDWLGFGERDSRRKPHLVTHYSERDPCNVHYLCATLLGMTMLGLNCHEGAAATDFVASQPFVDADKLGVMGLSFGGTMTTWLTLTDARYKAADIICYAGPFHDIAYRTYNVCGSQITPGLFALCDTAELQGLIAPRPLLVEIGIHDSCFHVDHTLNRHYRQLERIYDAAGAREQLELDLFPSEHAWGGNKSVAFFRKHLG